MYFFFFDDNIPPYRDNWCFTRKEVEDLLNWAKGKTLKEADRRNVFSIAETRPDKVVKGIAGCVIEQSVLGLKKDSRQEPDIIVDGIRTELKTTGVRKPKKDIGQDYEAKEPLTITHISPDEITKETFENSHFYEKIEHLLFVFYHYLLSEAAKSTYDYFDFPILGHLFWSVPSEDVDCLRQDWLKVRQYYRDVKDGKKTDNDYSALQKELLRIDTSAPSSPRFRFKRAYVSTIVETFLKKDTFVSIPQRITKFSDIDEKCRAFADKHRNKTLDQLSEELGITFVDSKGKYDKDACQRIIIKAFDSNASSINQIKDFAEIGLTAKTIVLTSEGKRTEDMKMSLVDFDEWCSEDVVFYDADIDKEHELFETNSSETYSYFAENPFLFIIFQEPYKQEKGKPIPLGECRFVGFKRYSFSNSFIFNNVQKTWNEVRRLVFTKELKEVRSGSGFAPNFPKSKDNIVFLRGSGSDSSDKKPRLKNRGIDINMYIQYLWIRGDYIVKELEKQDYL